MGTNAPRRAYSLRQGSCETRKCRKPRFFPRAPRLKWRMNVLCGVWARGCQREGMSAMRRATETSRDAGRSRRTLHVRADGAQPEAVLVPVRLPERGAGRDGIVHRADGMVAP